MKIDTASHWVTIPTTVAHQLTKTIKIMKLLPLVTKDISKLHVYSVHCWLHLGHKCPPLIAHIQTQVLEIVWEISLV